MALVYRIIQITTDKSVIVHRYMTVAGLVGIHKKIHHPETKEINCAGEISTESIS